MFIRKQAGQSTDPELFINNTSYLLGWRNVVEDDVIGPYSSQTVQDLREWCHDDVIGEPAKTRKTRNGQH
jgi:hypothetical protein